MVVASAHIHNYLHVLSDGYCLVCHWSYSLMMCIAVPVFVVPSIFCISPTGDQLAVYSGAADPNKIVSTLSLGLQVCHNICECICSMIAHAKTFLYHAQYYNLLMNCYIVE